ncbi:Peptide chain release factor 1 [Maioricimonas rarisocia]|uniref:Peptide chain release factor 1 n=1 Tax=Maioricimonas rarisocia TaxID=2528026 RepID=A0A517Z2T7_9PLAN|nr:peptide chain release factor-like protein [Maioricimonas rarisocia]QDU36789.1 Peptide chain release factor 1 [Maioricimonas rarisocia]
MTDAAPHPAGREEEALLAECRMRQLRRSGPGGQHRNKVSTAIQLTHEPTGLIAEAGERRSQADNRRVAVRRLRMQLALEVRQPAPSERSPSTLWQQRCRSGRIEINAGHADFPLLLAEALDFVASDSGDLQAAAGRLGCTASQLSRLLKMEPRAWQWLNALRKESGLRPLR